MRRVPRLGKLQVLATRRALRLRSLVDSYALPVTSDCDRSVSYVAIEALNLWASFARSYYLSCLLGTKQVDGTGVTITIPGIQNVGDAMTFSIRTMKLRLRTGRPRKRRDEPTWHEPHTLLRLLGSVGASTLPNVHAAFAYPTAVFLHLPTFRNFFAHRNEDTARKTARIARRYGLSPKLRPSEILCSKTTGRPQNILADWLDDLRNVIQLMC